MIKRLFFSFLSLWVSTSLDNRQYTMAIKKWWVAVSSLQTIVVFVDVVAVCCWLIVAFFFMLLWCCCHLLMSKMNKGWYFCIMFHQLLPSNDSHHTSMCTKNSCSLPFCLCTQIRLMINFCCCCCCCWLIVLLLIKRLAKDEGEMANSDDGARADVTINMKDEERIWQSTWTPKSSRLNESPSSSIVKMVEWWWNVWQHWRFTETTNCELLCSWQWTQATLRWWWWWCWVWFVVVL